MAVPLLQRCMGSRMARVHAGMRATYLRLGCPTRTVFKSLSILLKRLGSI